MSQCKSLTQRGKRCKNPIASNCRSYCKLHSTCRKYLSDKIRTNIKKDKWGHKQAIAISYSQVQKQYPKCKKIFKRK